MHRSFGDAGPQNFGEAVEVARICLVVIGAGPAVDRVVAVDAMPFKVSACAVPLITQLPGRGDDLRRGDDAQSRRKPLRRDRYEDAFHGPSFGSVDQARIGRRASFNVARSAGQNARSVTHRRRQKRRSTSVGCPSDG